MYFERELKIGFPMRVEADEIGHGKFVSSFERGGAPPQKGE